jgi:hypothetical protein
LVKGQADPKKLSKLILWGAAFPNQLAFSINLGSRIKELESEIASLKSATPLLKAGEVSTGDVNDMKPKANETMPEYIARTAHRVGL